MLAHRHLSPMSPGWFSDGTRDESHDRGVCHMVSAANLRKEEWQHRESSGMFVTWRKQAPGCWPAGNCAPVPAIKPCFCVSSHDRGEVLASQCLQGCFQNAGQVDHAGATLGQLLSKVKTIQFKASLGHPGGSWVG